MRSPKQIRLETAVHESGHAVAGFLSGRRIDHVRVKSEDELKKMEEEVLSNPGTIRDADRSGHVVFEPHYVNSLGEAIEEIVIYYAGEETTQMAWVAGFVTDEEIGGTPFTLEELEADVDLLMANGQTPPERAKALYGTESSPGDYRHADELAEAWTSDPMEKYALLGFCHARTRNLVQSELFRRMAVSFVPTIEEKGEVPGELAHHLLHRAHVVFELQEGGRKEEAT